MTEYLEQEITGELLYTCLKKGEIVMLIRRILAGVLTASMAISILYNPGGVVRAEEISQQNPAQAEENLQQDLQQDPAQVEEISQQGPAQAEVLETPEVGTPSSVEDLGPSQPESSPEEAVAAYSNRPSGICGENLTWELVDGTLTIRGSGEMYRYDNNALCVPWSAYRENIKKVTISNGMTSIGFAAFEACSSLASITIPNSVTSIEACAFNGCSSLASISIPNSVTTIGICAFLDCPSLANVYYGGSKSDWANISIGNDFDGNKALTNATIHYNSIGGTEKPKNISIYHGNGEIESFDLYLEDCIAKTPSTTYNPQLSHMLAALSRAAYSENNIRRSMASLGFENDNIYCHYGTGGWSNQISYSFGKKTLPNRKTLVLVTIKGSPEFNLINVEWLSNITLGRAVGSRAWHYGFESAVNEVYLNLKNFLGGNLGNSVFVVTGHSRGAAVANLLEVKLFDNEVSNHNVYGYNFACPDVAVGLAADWNWFGEHNNIFNIGNAPDPVSMLPGSLGSGISMVPTLGGTWGKFGQSRWFSADWNNPSQTVFSLKDPFSAHDQKRYLQYLREEPPFSSFKTWEQRNFAAVISTTISAASTVIESLGKLLSICCPVDVMLTDNEGNPIASVINGVPDYHNSEFGEVIIFTSGDRKSIFIAKDIPLTVHLTATDGGTMEYTVQDVDINRQEILAEKTFANVSLDSGKQFVSQVQASNDNTVSGNDLEEVKLYVTDEYGQPEKEVLPNDNGTEIPIGSEIGDVLPKDIPADGIIPDGLWAAGVTDADYTGNVVTQSFRLYDGATLLKEKTDYTVSYKNNRAACTYTEGDYADFEENLAATGRRVKRGSFDPSRAPQAILKMRGNYTGSKILYFQIRPAELSGEAFSVEPLTVTYSGKKQTPAPALLWNGKPLRYGTDFYVPEYDLAKSDRKAFTASGAYSLTVRGKKNFAGEIPVTLTISTSSKQIAMNKVTVKGLKNQVWTGLPFTPSGFTVSFQKDVLSEENGDYTVRFGKNTDVGTGTVTLAGTGTDSDGDGYSYIGTKTVSFKITGTAMSAVKASGIARSYTYTGSEIKPEEVLTYQANKKASPVTLVKDLHYTVSYQKNRDKGTATVIFTGLAGGGYTGTKKQTFQITSSGIGDVKKGDAVVEKLLVSFKDTANVRDGVYTIPCRKGGVAPEVSVASEGRTLEPGKDYTLSYTNNKRPALSTAANAPTITITGKGNYAGRKQVHFTILPKALTNENGFRVVAADKTASARKGGYLQSFKVCDVDGKALGTSDYDKNTVTYTLIQSVAPDGTVLEKNELLNRQSVVPAGSIVQIQVTGKGDYAGGSATGTYRILNGGHDISTAMIQLNNQPYTGEPVEITEQGQFREKYVYIKIGKEKKTLLLGQDIEVVPGSYSNNRNAGTAKVTFRGIHDFGGTKTVSYKIGTRSISSFWKGLFQKVGRIWE